MKSVISKVISSQCVYMSAFIPQADYRNASFKKESIVQRAQIFPVNAFIENMSKRKGSKTVCSDACPKQYRFSERMKFILITQGNNHMLLKCRKYW